MYILLYGYGPCSLGFYGIHHCKLGYNTIHIGFTWRAVYFFSWLALADSYSDICLSGFWIIHKDFRRGPLMCSICAIWTSHLLHCSQHYCNSLRWSAKACDLRLHACTSVDGVNFMCVIIIKKLQKGWIFPILKNFPCRIN